ncbi:uncharacterized protein BXZ73DRAFT_96727 [Epithele typhae]|uniref:uncharacterized protein n=1 Tax=Epithele typhae TaxID=378194 RepID=UPI002007387F|nr:uncharacterized protein BXZ73DRAFT_96727 [Epithele typhae]KAH9944237.1 hypothetical protein BXZ73DRAFT_96727 [Epithele typhae]
MLRAKVRASWLSAHRVTRHMYSTHCTPLAPHLRIRCLNVLYHVLHLLANHLSSVNTQRLALRKETAHTPSLGSSGTWSLIGFGLAAHAILHDVQLLLNAPCVSCGTQALALVVPAIPISVGLSQSPQVSPFLWAGVHLPLPSRPHSKPESLLPHHLPSVDTQVENIFKPQEADLLRFIVQKESKHLELHSPLAAHKLAQLKRQ